MTEALSNGEHALISSGHALLMRISAACKIQSWWYLSPVAAAALLLGLLVSHHEMFGSGFARTPGDPSDAVLVQFSLEHDFLWLIQRTPHKRFWDTPMFYPEKGATAHTDLMLGTLPFYAPFRMLGIAPDSAYQIWLLAVCALNFVAFYWMLREAMGFTEFPSVAGAYLFTFAAPRMIQEWHPQCVPCFYIVISFAGLCLALRREQIRFGWLLFFAGIVAQAYTAYYFTWFYLAGCLIAVLIAFFWYRPTVKAVVLNDGRLLLVLGGATLLACLPVATHLLAVALEIGARSYQEVRGYLPGFPSWFKQGSGSWYYAWLDTALARWQTAGFWEECNGIGLLTTALVVAGLWMGRKRTAARITFLVGITLVILSFRTPGGLSLWIWVHDGLPGAGGVRAVGRIGLMTLIPAGIALASVIERMPLAWGVLTLMIVGLEQGGNPPTFEKSGFRNLVSEVQANIRPDCQSFLFSPGRDWSPVLGHTAAIWAVNRTGIPTLNAASGGDPLDWKFADSRILAEGDRSRLRSDLIKWQAGHRELRNVCWIQQSGEGKYHAEKVDFDHALPQ